MDKQIIISLIDPFGERPHLLDKSEEELMKHFETMNNTLYVYHHKDYAPGKVLPTLAKKFRDLSSREAELERREQMIRKKEADYGIRSTLRTRQYPFFESPPAVMRSSQRQTKPAEEKNPDNVRPPDPVRRMRLIDDDEDMDEETRRAIEMSRNDFYRKRNDDDDIQRAIQLSQQDARREEDESYRLKIERERQEEERLAKKQQEEQEQLEKALLESTKPRVIEEKPSVVDPNDIQINMEYFKDKPEEVTYDFLKDVCILLKQQDFDGARKKIAELSVGSTSWFVRLKCETGTLKNKIVSRDVEAYKCILCRKI